MAKLLICGYGYLAKFVARLALQKGWQVIATTRKADKFPELEKAGITPVLWPEGDMTDRQIQNHLLRQLPENISCLLSTVPPLQGGADPVLPVIAPMLQKQLYDSLTLKWVGYVSATSVYGDAEGQYVTEDTPCQPVGQAGQARHMAEQAWINLTLPHVTKWVFRLSGIYGPGQNALEDFLRGPVKLIEKKGHFFNRIYVEDAAAAIFNSMIIQSDKMEPNTLAQQSALNIVNVSDDQPSSRCEVLIFAAKLLGVPTPPLLAFEEEQSALSDRMREFYLENKRVDNTKLKELLLPKLMCPTYREGLQKLFYIVRGKEPFPHF